MGLFQFISSSYASSAGMQQEKIVLFFFKLEKKMYMLQKEHVAAVGYFCRVLQRTVIQGQR
jgi:hypothetical protein